MKSLAQAPIVSCQLLTQHLVEGRKPRLGWAKYLEQLKCGPGVFNGVVRYTLNVGFQQVRCQKPQAELPLPLQVK